MKTGLIISDTSQNHDTGPGHPEQIARVSVIIENFKKHNNKNLIWKKSSRVSDDILLTTHDKNYLNLIKSSFPKRGFSSLDGDTIVSPGSKDATFDAVGSIIAAIDGVEKKEFRNAFCGVRPPGHHSSQNKAAGFCILNSVSIGANYLLRKYKYKKVAIIDFDVHHGNGTQEIFYNDNSVAYASTHEHPLFPGTGAEDEIGVGNIFNVPLKSGTEGVEFLKIFESKIIKPLDKFKPEIILISAGFDAHFRDPLASINLESSDFFKITKKIIELANIHSNGRVISFFEGGYNLQALSESVKEHLIALKK